MHTDVSRDSFEPVRHFLRVIQQQGRVLLDADFNEQAAIFARWLRTLTRDIVGHHWGPSAEGFKIKFNEPAKDSLTIGGGRYYVDGLPCEQDALDGPLDWKLQPDFRAPDTLPSAVPYLVYLEAFERHQTAYEARPAAPTAAAKVDGTDPLVWDPALGHLDTTTRTRLTWRVRILTADRPLSVTEDAVKAVKGLDAPKLWQAVFKDLLAKLQALAGGASPDHKAVLDSIYELFNDRFEELPFRPEAMKTSRGRDAYAAHRPTLSAGTTGGRQGDDCAVGEKGGYRGDENQLFRVEVHSVELDTKTGRVFKVHVKWARDNASHIFPIEKWEENQKRFVLRHIGRDPGYALAKNQLVEYEDDSFAYPAYAKEVEVSREAADDHALQLPRFYRIESFDEIDHAVTVRGRKPRDPVEAKLHPLLRRWDGAFMINLEIERPELEHKLCLGVSVEFDALPLRYARPGDYWLIPARVATQDVIWPLNKDQKPQKLPPRNPLLSFAPLAFVNVGADPRDLRRTNDPYNKP